MNTYMYAEICNAFFILSLSLSIHVSYVVHILRLYKNKHSSMQENEMNPFIQFKTTKCLTIQREPLK